MKKGFTLLELLIAMVVLSISMMGLFTLLRQSIDMNDYAKRKLDLTSKAYERVFLSLIYPTKVFDDTVTDNSTIYTYKLEKNDTGFSGIKECELTLDDGDAEVNLYYYER
jgi:prepilin-type N-terminal cleavage/methylation domain-containing protein